MRTTKTALGGLFIVLFVAACATGGSMYTFDRNELESVPTTSIGGDPPPAVTPGTELVGREVLRIDQGRGTGRVVWTVDRVPAGVQMLVAFDFAIDGAADLTVVVYRGMEEPVRLAVTPAAPGAGADGGGSLEPATGGAGAGAPVTEASRFTRFASPAFEVSGNAVEVELEIEAAADARLYVDNFVVKQAP